jgi:replication protein
VLRVSGEGDQRSAGMAGLQSCGHLTCPVCSAKVGAHRAADLVQVLRYHRDAYPDRPYPVSGGAVLITLTLRHSMGMALLFLLAALRYAWGRVTSGNAYTRELATFGVVGWVASLEITWSRMSAFHPHLHVLAFTDTPLSDDMAFELGGCWFARWERAMARRGIQSIINKGGLDARSCDLSDMSTGALGDYLAKIGAEVTRADRKDGRDGSFSMMGLAREAMGTYEAQALAAWWELESTLDARKSRFVSWSRGGKELRERAGLAAEQAKEEAIAAADLGGEDMIAIDPADWPRLRLVVEVLYRLVEQDGIAAAAAWLSSNRIAWSWATPAPRLQRQQRPSQRAPRPSRPPGRARPRAGGPQ